ncbi:hypothetical protein Tco_0180483 [Tanacetum coccineum]
MVPATAPFIGFSEKIIIWQWEKKIIATSKNRNAKHSTSTLWHDFVVEEYSHCEAARLSYLTCRFVSGREDNLSLSLRATEERIKVAIHPKYPWQTIVIGSTLMEEGRKELCDLLRRNLDIFTWKPADMTGVPWHIAEHQLKVQERIVLQHRQRANLSGSTEN